MRSRVCSSIHPLWYSFCTLMVVTALFHQLLFGSKVALLNFWAKSENQLKSWLTFKPNIESPINLSLKTKQYPTLKRYPKLAFGFCYFLCRWVCSLLGKSSGKDSPGLGTDFTFILSFVPALKAQLLPKTNESFSARLFFSFFLNFWTKAVVKDSFCCSFSDFSLYIFLSCLHLLGTVAKLCNRDTDGIREAHTITLRSM